MEISPIILEGQQVRLEPLSPAHEEVCLELTGPHGTKDFLATTFN